MKKFSLVFLGMSLIGATSYSANLWIVGDATPYGWSLDDATALLSTPDNSSFYTGTIYLKASSNFKFLTVPDFGDTDYPQYGAAKDATLTDGTIKLAAGTDDDFNQLQVSTDGNYYITVDTEALEATLELAAYQSTEIGLCSLFLVGDATVGGWSVDDGTPLYQVKETPYVYSADVALSAGSFKIATVMKGAGSWDSKYYYFADPSNPDKIILNNSEDTQWNITEENNYTVTVNTIAETISITKSSDTSVLNFNMDANSPVEYYTISGVKTQTPQKGIFIRKQGKKVEKVIFK